jgi:hypothetical protein
MTAPLSRTQTAHLIRVTLKRTFPGIKFSVVVEVRSDHGTIDISWDDGPAWEGVDGVVKPLEGHRFDQLTQLNYYVKRHVSRDGSRWIASHRLVKHMRARPFAVFGL